MFYFYNVVEEESEFHLLSVVIHTKNGLPR